ncbi:MAG TPA: L-histidine N(alpha)-methyltransferase [Burkholderiales bacterium]|nr:L-histidine N(alpha)-methyltransferase [Burkholderiales bacterium]
MDPIFRTFREDVVGGLSLPQKALPPKYFYDAIGSKLFERICRLPEYYVTRAELSLTRQHVSAIARFAGRGCELLEYGSGESLKTRLLIRVLRPKTYLPIDISADALDRAARRLGREFPKLRIVPVAADFSRPFELPAARAPRTAYFPGSTIGNLTYEEAQGFLARSRAHAKRMLIGTDLRKDANLLHAAYNDARGVTAAFNLNLLARINRELGADFDLRAFSHYAFYNASPGRIEMHLVSLKKQGVKIGRHRFSFQRGETIHTENSYKYSIEGFGALAANAGFTQTRCWTDRKGLFALHGLTSSSAKPRRSRSSA